MNATDGSVLPIKEGHKQVPLNRRSFMALSAAAFGLVTLQHAHAAPSSSDSSILEQGRRYNEGTGVPRDYQKAARLFKKAADAGSVEAQAWLGSMYLWGHGLPQSDMEARELITTSAAQDHPIGLRFAGILHQEGQAVPQDYTKAREFYERAAEKGDSVSNGRLGMLYLWGRGVTANRAKAKDYLLKGASGGDPWSMVELGMVYRHSPDKSERSLAVEQYSQAAEKGNRVGAYRLACAYHYGMGTKKDPMKAAKFLHQSAFKGFPLAQGALSKMYAEGTTVPKDMEVAYALCTLAAHQGERRSEVYRHFLARKMTVTQIERANSLADKIRARNPQSQFS